MKKLFIGAVLLLGACVPPPTPKDQSHTPKVITPDWGIAQTLIALDHPPVAMGEIDGYADWATTPVIPDGVVDIGLRFSPNAELFSQLDADVIIDNAFYTHLRVMYRDIAHQEVSLTVDKVATWENFATYTHQIAQVVGKESQVEPYLTKSKDEMASHGQSFRQKYPSIQQVAIVQFANAQNYRLYTTNSLFQVATEQMGLSLYAPMEGNAWGFADQHLGKLAKLPSDVCLVVISPFSQMLQHELAHNELWRNMGFGSSRCMVVLPPVWIYGGVPSLVGFSQELAMAKVVGFDDDKQ